MKKKRRKRFFAPIETQLKFNVEMKQKANARLEKLIFSKFMLAFIGKRLSLERLIVLLSSNFLSGEKPPRFYWVHFT